MNESIPKFEHATVVEASILGSGLTGIAGYLILNHTVMGNEYNQTSGRIDRLKDRASNFEDSADSLAQHAPDNIQGVNTLLDLASKATDNASAMVAEQANMYNPNDNIRNLKIGGGIMTLAVLTATSSYFVRKYFHERNQKRAHHASEVNKKLWDIFPNES